MPQKREGASILEEADLFMGSQGYPRILGAVCGPVLRCINTDDGSVIAAHPFQCRPVLPHMGWFWI